MQDPACELPRIHILSTSVNKLPMHLERRCKVRMEMVRRQQSPGRPRPLVTHPDVVVERQYAVIEQYLSKPNGGCDRVQITNFTIKSHDPGPTRGPFCIGTRLEVALKSHPPRIQYAVPRGGARAVM